MTLRRISLVVLAVLAGALAATVANAATTSTVNMQLRPTPKWASGQFRSHIKLRSPRRVRVTLSMVVDARADGHAKMFAALCWTRVEEVCSDAQKFKVLPVKQGRNRLRWRFTMTAPQTINSVDTYVFDMSDGASSAFGAHIIH